MNSNGISGYNSSNSLSRAPMGSADLKNSLNMWVDASPPAVQVSGERSYDFTNEIPSQATLGGSRRVRRTRSASKSRKASGKSKSKKGGEKKRVTKKDSKTRKMRGGDDSNNERKNEKNNSRNEKNSEDRNNSKNNDRNNNDKNEDRNNNSMNGGSKKRVAKKSTRKMRGGSTCSYEVNVKDYIGNMPTISGACAQAGGSKKSRSPSKKSPSKAKTASVKKILDKLRVLNDKLKKIMSSKH